jgi:hypothetical protein
MSSLQVRVFVHTSVRSEVTVRIPCVWCLPVNTVHIEIANIDYAYVVCTAFSA